MMISRLSTDDAVLTEVGRRLGRHRLQRNQTQADLAHQAGISKRTLERMEAGHSTQLTSLIRALRALDLLDGIEQLVPEPGPNPIELLEMQGRQRERASSSSDSSSEDSGGPGAWTWGDP